jgi:hypothetical protein
MKRPRPRLYSVCLSGAIIAALTWLAIFLFLSMGASAQETVATIIQRSDEANKRDWDAAPQFDDCERDREKGSDKTYAVTMLFGSPYQRLVAVNGRPLSPTQQQEEQKKFEDAKAQRQGESKEERSQRIAKYQAERARDQTMINQMTAAFNFRLIGDRTMNGHTVYVLKATPRKGYRPPNRDSEALTGMEGTLWIDHDTFQWVKVEAHVAHPVMIEGFLAEVEPGTKFELEKQPVSEGLWLASHFSMQSRARILRLIPRSGQEDDTYFDYHQTGQSPDGKPNTEEQACGQ